MTEEEAELYRQKIQDPSYMDSAVESIAAGLMNGSVKFELPDEMYCPKCKSMRKAKDFYLNSNGKNTQAWCKPCFRMYLKKRAALRG
jgi:hypothetical protein